jgi:hypothetical protein
MILFMKYNKTITPSNRISNNSYHKSEFNYNSNSRLFDYIKQRNNIGNKIIKNHDKIRPSRNQEQSIGDYFSSIPVANSKFENFSSLLVENNLNTNAKDLNDHRDDLINLIKKTQMLLLKKKTNDNNRIKENNSNIITEWKEVANRVDLILFYLSSFVTLVAPLVLFGKYPFSSVEQTIINQNGCSCDYCNI